MIIFGRSQTEHDVALEEVLVRLQEKGLTANLQTFQFNMPEIKFFGVIHSKDGISTDPEKVEDLQVSKNRGELRRMLGLMTYFSRFLEDYTNSRAIEETFKRKGLVELE